MMFNLFKEMCDSNNVHRSFCSSNHYATKLIVTMILMFAQNECLSYNKKGVVFPLNLLKVTIIISYFQLLNQL